MKRTPDRIHRTNKFSSSFRRTKLIVTTSKNFNWNHPRGEKFASHRPLINFSSSPLPLRLKLNRTTLPPFFFFFLFSLFGKKRNKRSNGFRRKGNLNGRRGRGGGGGEGKKKNRYVDVDERWKYSCAAIKSIPHLEVDAKEKEREKKWMGSEFWKPGGRL